MVVRFEDALSIAQKYMSEQHEGLMSREEVNREIVRTHVENKLKEYYPGEDLKETIDRIIMEMIDFSFLSLYLDRTDVEEININAWNDTKIIFDDGRVEPAVEQFRTPQHAKDTIVRLLAKSKMTIDDAKPITIGHLSKKIRITAVLEGVADHGSGINASIRIVNPKQFTEEELVESGMATKEMLDLISTSYINKKSVCFIGETGSGKTTLMSNRLEKVPHDKRLITLEFETREFDLVRKDKDGSVINSVIHWVTRSGKGDSMDVTMIKLVQTAMTFDPDYLVVAEMKSDEAFEAINAANTGHPIMTTIHSKSCYDSYYRMLTLTRQKYDMDEKMVLELAVRAFPLTVYCEKYKDNKRRISEMCEATGIDEHGRPILNTLYRFQVSRNYKAADGKHKVEGEFVKVNEPSESFKEDMKQKGWEDYESI